MNHTEGTRFELVCSFTGIPNPQILWEKGGSVFLLGEGRRVINSTGIPMRSQLVINSLTLSDAGVYTCSVTNDAGMATRSVKLQVRGEGQLVVMNPPVIKHLDLFYLFHFSLLWLCKLTLHSYPTM